MKKKTILRTEWKGINDRLYAEKRFECEGVCGMAGLLYMRGAEDFYVRSGGERLKITGRDYSWLQLAPENRHVWATVMFDEAGELFQCYFDITARNCVLDGGRSWFEDLYLDVVTKTKDETLYLYDEDELLAACKNGGIDEEMVQTAYSARRELLSCLKAHRQPFFDFCRALRSELMPELKPVNV